MGLVRLTGQHLELHLSEQRTVGVVGRAHLRPDRPAQAMRELVLNLPDLVQLASSQNGVVEDVHDGLAQGAAAIEHDQDLPGHVQTVVTQADEQIRCRGGVLGRALHQRERMPGAL